MPIRGSWRGRERGTDLLVDWQGLDGNGMRIGV